MFASSETVTDTDLMFDPDLNLLFLPLKPTVLNPKRKRRKRKKYVQASEDYNDEQKRKKNRIAARECRRRKKQYIAALELENRALKEELASVKEKLATFA